MARKKKLDVIDDPDEPITTDEVPPAGTSPIADTITEVQRLLLWCREKGFAVPRLRVGDISLNVKDLRPNWGKMQETGPSDIYEEYGEGLK